MEKYIVKIRRGQHLRLRCADTKEGAVEHVVQAYRESLGGGIPLSFSKDGECVTDNKYQTCCAVFENDRIVLPTSQGGTFWEIDEAIKNLSGRAKRVVKT